MTPTPAQPEPVDFAAISFERFSDAWQILSYGTGTDAVRPTRPIPPLDN